MIRSFRDAETEKIFRQEFSKRFQSVVGIALRKLIHMNQARTLQDLGKIPGNKLEALKRDRKGQHAIRINDQFRVCFTWTEQGVLDVEITDYH